MTNSNDNKTGFGLSQFQRNRYFYGKLMTVKDFEVEQDYMNEKRRLLNRLVAGAGVICGLRPDQDDVEISNAGGNIKIKFVTGGAAIDGWGREIVIPIEDSPRDIRIKQGSTQVNLTLADLGSAAYYLYLEYDPREGEMVSSASESSGCEETCCPSRVIENFQVIASTTPPDTLTIVCPVFTDEPTEIDARKKVKKWLVDQTSELCGIPMESKIFFLALKKGSALLIDQQTTAQYLTFVANNRALSELLACHISDFSNPHNTTAAQVGALTSVDGVGNPGGNVDLVAQNSISIAPDDTANTITIGETHSGITGNPHGTNHSQLNGVLGARAAVPNQDKHIAAQDVVKWDSAVYKVGGVQPNASGEILIKAGSNIAISPSGPNEITITSAGGVMPKTGAIPVQLDSNGSAYVIVDPGFSHYNYMVYLGFEDSSDINYSGFSTDTMASPDLRDLVRSASTTSINGDINTAAADFTISTQPTFTILPTLPTQPTLPIEPTFTILPTLPTQPTFTILPTFTTLPTFPTQPTFTILPTFTTFPTFPTLPTIPIPRSILNMSSSVFKTGPNANKFAVYIASNMSAHTIQVRWWAIPGEVVAAPTATLPTVTFTIPTYTFTTPTLTIPTPTLTIIPTLTQTIPTLTIPTLTIMPTFTQTIPTLTIMPTLTQTIPTLTVMPTLTQTMPTFTVMPTFTFMPKTATPTTPKMPTTMPTVITPGVGYLADITGIGPVIADKLTAGGITSIAQLAAAAPGHVAEILGYSTTTKAAAFIKEAKSLMGKK